MVTLGLSELYLDAVANDVDCRGQRLGCGLSIQSCSSFITQGLSEVPLEAVTNAVEARVQAVDLSKNSFTAFPQVRYL